MDEHEIAHVSWRDVGAQIKTMHDTDAFGQEEVAAFIRQYLVAVGRLIGPEESDADYFRKLLDDHHSLLKYMVGVLGDEGGEQEVRAMVPERHAHYQDTVVRLVKDFGQEPERLRSAVRDLLTSRGIKTTITASKGKVWLWLSWDLQETQGLGLGGTGGHIYWVVEFALRSVVVKLQSYPGRRDAVDRIVACMRKIPVDRRRRDRYPMKAGAFNYFDFYHHELVGDEILSGESTRGGHAGRAASRGRIPGRGGFGLHAHQRLLPVPGVSARGRCGGSEVGRYSRSAMRISEPERGIGRDATGRLPCRSEHRQVHLHHARQEVREPQARRSDGLTGTGEGGEEKNVLVFVALILVSVLVLSGMVTFYAFGRLHHRRIERTGRPIRKGDETSAIGSESVEGLRRGGPLLRRAGCVLEAEHGFCGELQVDGEAGAVHGQTQSSDAVFVGPSRPQPFAIDQGRTRTRRG